MSPKPKKNNNWKTKFIIGVMFLTLSFGVAIYALYELDAENKELNQYIKRLEPTKTHIKNTVDLKKLQEKTKGMDGYFSQYLQDILVVNPKTEKVFLIRGKSMGIKKESSYGIYRDSKLIGYFEIDMLYDHISFGHISHYNDDFPKNEACFQTTFSSPS